MMGIRNTSPTLLQYLQQYVSTNVRVSSVNYIHRRKGVRWMLEDQTIWVTRTSFQIPEKVQSLIRQNRHQDKITSFSLRFYHLPRHPWCLTWIREAYISCPNDHWPTLWQGNEPGPVPFSDPPIATFLLVGDLLQKGGFIFGRRILWEVLDRQRIERLEKKRRETSETSRWNRSAVKELFVPCETESRRSERDMKRNLREGGLLISNEKVEKIQKRLYSRRVTPKKTGYINFNL